MGKFVSYKILPELELILCNLQGSIVLSDLVELNIQFLGDNLYNPLYKVILDFRDSLTIGYRIDVAEYIKFFKESVRLKKTVKVGILFNTPNQEFLFKIYKTLGKLVKLDIELYSELDSCLIWMGFSESGQDQIRGALVNLKKENIC